MTEDSRKKKRIDYPHEDGNQKFYLDQLRLAPGIQRFLSDASLITEIRSAGDYSYSAPRYAGTRYRIAGDAGGKSMNTFLAPNFRQIGSVHRSILLLWGPLGFCWRALCCCNYHGID